MPQPLKTDALAALARVRVEDVQRYVDRGLLDPDRDGILDELDVLRLRILMHYQRVGYSLDDLEKAIREHSPRILYSDLLFSTQDSLTPQEAADKVGLDVDDVIALRRAIGLEGNIPRSDLPLLEAVRLMVDGGVPMKVLVDMARVYGDTLRRLAESEVRMIRSFIVEPGKSAVLKDRDQSERLEAVQGLVGNVIEPLLLNIHRQHLLRASVQQALSDVEAAERGEDRETQDATIVFVDLASFTALAQVHGDEIAAEVLDRFDDLVRTLLEGRNGSLVKYIGDEAMLVFSSPSEAVRFAVDLEDAASNEPNFPALRGAIHSGPVLYRVGDYVGNTVNIASRISGLAHANEILLTESVAKAADEIGIATEPAGSRLLAGVDEPVTLWRVATKARTTHRERDPVCGMALGEDVAAHLVYGGYEFGFCSQACLRRFLEDPGKYTKPEDAKKP